MVAYVPDNSPGSLSPSTWSDALDLMESAYAASGDGEWRQGFRRFRDRFGLTFVFVTTLETSGAAVFPGLSSEEESSVSSYFQQWKGSDPRMTRFVRAAQSHCGRILSDELLFTPRELTRSAFHNEYLRSRGHGDFVGFCEQARGREYFFAAGLEIGQPVPDNSTRLLLRQIGRHFVRAVSNWVEAKGGETINEAILSHSQQGERGVVVVDGKQRVLHMSLAAATILDREFSLAGSRLCFRRPEWQRRVDRLLEGALKAMSDPGDFGPVALQRSPDRLPLLASATPLRPQQIGVLGDWGATMLVFTDLEARKTASVAALTALGLTPAEASMAALVGTAHAPVEAAKVLGVTEATARGTIAAIYAKLGLTRQAQLVQLVSRL